MIRVKRCTIWADSVISEDGMELNIDLENVAGESKSVVVYLTKGDLLKALCTERGVEGMVVIEDGIENFAEKLVDVPGILYDDDELKPKIVGEIEDSDNWLFDFEEPKEDSDIFGDTNVEPGKE